jgi:GTP 3',8-cyclase
MAHPILSPVRKSCLVDNMIIPPTHLELIVVDHCNISCKSCNHASPLMPPWFADPVIVYRDLSIMAKYLRPKFLKIIGGEPFLHKQLIDVIRAARTSGITNHIILTTNGTLLDKIDDALWAEIDELEISVYPGMEGIWQNILSTREKALPLGKKITVNKFDKFRATFCAHGPDDPNLPGKIFAACKIANFWGCHAVRDGFFYKCPQSIYVPMLTETAGETDRFAILDHESYQADLLDFINSPTPLFACNYCVGTVGIHEEVEQQSCDQWRDHIERKMEDIVDFDWMEKSLVNKTEKDDCKKRMYFRLSHTFAPISLFNRMLLSLMSERSARLFFRQGKSHDRR